ncbi:MAG: twin-arginine translocase subunit TatC [Deltaproteobacteria bacterium]|nr:twin-arginine translocase subunit TatC [Deltaproteobacteria bacterium]
MVTTEQKALPGPEGEIEDTKMPLIEHLRELRRRLLTVFITIFIAFCGAWAFSGEILTFIKAPVAPYGKLQFDTLSDPFFTHMKASFYAALFLTFPLTLWQIWMFVGPGLYKQEKKIAWPFLFLSFPLFVGGGLFCFYIVFPQAVDFLINFDKDLLPSLRIGDYLSFILQLIFVFGLIFELPLISLLLTRVGLLTPTMLHKNRRYSIVIIFIVAAILTPTPDVYTQTLMAIPLMVLYEVSVLVSWLALPRKSKKKAEAQS